MSKQYGLIKPDKAKKAAAAKVANVFGDCSSDEDAPKKKPRTSGVSLTQKKLTEKLQEEALAVDPNIFQYDEVYDEIDSKRKEAKQAKKSAEAKAPKYITKLLETAEKRKQEHERRVERQVQKEREAEGEEFKDKEAFVTSTYRKKLEEMREAEEADKREAYLEIIGDVTKQSDLSGFYRHIFEQKLTPDEAKAKEAAVAAVKADFPAPETSGKKKNYRKRNSSADQKDDSDKEDAEKKAHLVSNLDADSDFSIDSDSEDEKKPVTIKEEPIDPPTESKEPVAETNGKTELEVVDVKVEETEEPPKPKIDIWKKRTVGEVFDKALERYYQRKAEKEQAA